MALYLTESELEALDEARTKEEYLANKKKERVDAAEKEYKIASHRADGNESGPNMQAYKHAKAKYGKDSFKKAILGDDELADKIWDTEVKTERKARPSASANFRASREYNRRQDVNDPNKDNLPRTGVSYWRAADAANRHMRRHPEQYKESAGIFESVEII